MRVWFCDTMEKQNRLWFVGASGRCMDRPVRRVAQATSSCLSLLFYCLSRCCPAVPGLALGTLTQYRHWRTNRNITKHLFHAVTNCHFTTFTLCSLHLTVTPLCTGKIQMWWEMTILRHCYTAVSHLFDKKSITWRRRTILSCWAAQTTVNNAPGKTSTTRSRGNGYAGNAGLTLQAFQWIMAAL